MRIAAICGMMLIAGIAFCSEGDPWWLRTNSVSSTGGVIEVDTAYGVNPTTSVFRLYGGIITNMVIQGKTSTVYFSSGGSSGTGSVNYSWVSNANVAAMASNATYAATANVASNVINTVSNAFDLRGSTVVAATNCNIAFVASNLTSSASNAFYQAGSTVYYATQATYAVTANTASNLDGAFKPASSTNADYATWANNASNVTVATYATTANVASNVINTVSNAFDLRGSVVTAATNATTAYVASNLVSGYKPAASTNSDYATYANTASNVVAGYKMQASTNADYATWANTASNLVGGWKIQNATNADVATYATTANVASNLMNTVSNAFDLRGSVVTAATNATTAFVASNLTSAASNAVGSLLLSSNNVWTGTNTFSGTGVTISSNLTVGGIIGIGTTAPTSTVDVIGSTTIDNQANVAARFRATNGGASGAGVMVGVINGNAPYISDYSSAGTSIGLSFYTGYGTKINAMTIATNGYIGIGTTAPTSTVDVIGSTTIDNQANVAARFRAANGAASGAGVMVGVINGNAPYISDYSSAGTSVGLSFCAGYGTKINAMTIATNGYIGVQIQSPSGRFTVGNPASDTVSCFTNGIVFSDTAGGTAAPNVWNHGAIWTVGQSGHNGDMRFGTDGDGLQDTTGVVERLRITQDGAVVLIPTVTAPTAIQGGMYFDSTLKQMLVCTNTIWERFSK